MPKKLEWPVAKTERGRVAVWFDMFTWPLVRDGIVRKYLELREDEGKLSARRQARQNFPLTWKHNEVLKRWELLDKTWSLCASRSQEALKLYQAGFCACLGGAQEPCMRLITPERLVALGDEREQEANRKELVEIDRAMPNCDAGQLLEQKEVA